MNFPTSNYTLNCWMLNRFDKYIIMVMEFIPILEAEIITLLKNTYSQNLPWHEYPYPGLPIS